MRPRSTKSEDERTSSAKRKREAHRVTTSSAPVVRLTSDLEVVELSEKAPDLVRHNPERRRGGKIDLGGELSLRSSASARKRDIGGCESSTDDEMSADEESRIDGDLPFRVLQYRDHQLDRCRTRNGGDSRPGDGAHLVQSTVGEGLQGEEEVSDDREQARRSTDIHRRNNVVAVVAAESSGVGSTGRDLYRLSNSRRRSGGGGRKTVAHDEECVEAESDVHDKL